MRGELRARLTISWSSPNERRASMQAQKQIDPIPANPYAAEETTSCIVESLASCAYGYTLQ